MPIKQYISRLLILALVATLIAGFVAVFVPDQARAANWYNANWQYRKKITLNSDNISGSSSLTNFPVLISFTDTDLITKARNDGWDILFTAGDELTKLSHEVESFNGATGELNAWVKLPTLSPSVDTDIYMYYGYALASNQEDVTNVWDSNFMAVQHMEESSGGSDAVLDSTINDNDGTDVNSPTFGVAGIANGAISFNGANAEYINIGNDSSLDITGTITVESWIYPTTGGAYRGIVTKYQAAPGESYQLWFNGSGNIEFSVRVDPAGPPSPGTFAAAVGAPSLDQWTHVVGTYDGTNVNLYVNGVKTIGDAVTGAIESTTSDVTIGSVYDNSSSYDFIGTIDEPRISNLSRSSDWITTTFNNQDNPGDFLGLGSEEIPLSASTVTTDGAAPVEETTATINGTLTDDGGEANQYSFEWGTTSGVYTDNISWTGSITTGQSFNTGLTGLNKGDVYYFRAKVKNNAGISYGSELSFLTKPDGPVSLSATENGAYRIDLSWTKGEGANRTMVRRKEGTYPADYNDGDQVYFDTGTAVSDTSLSANTTYYYRAWSEVTGSQQWSDTFQSASATTDTAPNAVGGKVLVVSKVMVLAPWLGLGLAFSLLIAGFIIRVRRKSNRPPPGKGA